MGSRIVLQVEADDETRDDEHAGGIDLVDAVSDVAARVLLLACMNERLGVGRLDAGEDREEIRRGHEIEQLRVIGEIERRLGRELERITSFPLPDDQLGQELLERALVADKVVVDEVDMAAIAEVVERLQLAQHLGIALRARHPAEQFDDVAELAVEGTSARELHADIEIVLELQQVEARYRAGRDVDRELLGLEDAGAGPALPGAHEIRHDRLGLADDEELRLGKCLGTGHRVRPADDNRRSAAPRVGHDIHRAHPLRQHAAGHDDVGPVDIFVAQFLGVGIDQAQRPILGQKCRGPVTGPDTWPPTRHKRR